MEAESRTLYIGVDSAAVLPGRLLELQQLEICDRWMVLRYRVDPGITAEELRTTGRGLIWGAYLEDDVGTDYQDGLQSGGFATDETVTTGDRRSATVPPLHARFLTITVYSPSSRGEPYGREVLARHMPLIPSATTRDLAEYLDRRRRGRHALLTHISAHAGGEPENIAYAVNPFTHPWGRSLAAAGLIEQEATGWRATARGLAHLDANRNGKSV